MNCMIYLKRNRDFVLLGGGYSHVVYIELCGERVGVTALFD